MNQLSLLGGVQSWVVSPPPATSRGSLRCEAVSSGVEMPSWEAAQIASPPRVHDSVHSHSSQRHRVPDLREKSACRLLDGRCRTLLFEPMDDAVTTKRHPRPPNAIHPDCAKWGPPARSAGSRRE